ncbi:MAG: hypothetical protein JRJ84_01265 [Deltaproteobacteria bacterium]|nr:hypothetical protein [Deltaproteobacteria bacterium]
MLREDNELSAHFPEAYHAVAQVLDTSRVWMCWRYDGLRYDGLVWVNDHWAWFPKPWRVLSELG